MKKPGTGFWLIIIAVVATGLFLWFIIGSQIKEQKKNNELTSREVALTCTTDMATQFHIHPTLSIIIDGEPYVIPANIGVTETCMNSIHTHDAVGTLHVEAPVKKDFTLGDFFAVWEQPFDQDHILDKTATADKKIIVTVNGEPVETFENTLLVDSDQIVIEYK